MLETLRLADQELFLSLNSLHSDYWDQFMWIFTAKWPWIPMYAAILYVICKNMRPSVSLLAVISVVLTIVYADQLCATLIRPLVERMRPSNPDNPIHEWVHIVNGKRGGKYGFPSCHAANSFGLAFFVMLLFKNRLLTFFILTWAVINSYSRIYIGVHYPGDLFVGMLIGLSGAMLLYRLYRYCLHRFVKSDLHPRYPMRYTRVIILTGCITALLIALYSVFRH